MTSVAFVPRYAGPLDARSAGTYAERATKTLPNYEGQLYYQTDDGGGESRGAKIFEDGAWKALADRINATITHIENIQAGTLDRSLLVPLTDGEIPASKVAGVALAADLDAAIAQIPDVSDLLTDSSALLWTNVIGAPDFATSADIPDVSGFATTADVDAAIAALHDHPEDVTPTRSAKVEVGGVTSDLTLLATPSTDLVEVQLGAAQSLGSAKLKLPAGIALLPSETVQTWDEDGTYLGRRHVSLKSRGDFHSVVENVHYTRTTETIDAVEHEVFDFAPSASLAKASRLRFGYALTHPSGRYRTVQVLDSGTFEVFYTFTASTFRVETYLEGVGLIFAPGVDIPYTIEAPSDGSTVYKISSSESARFPVVPPFTDDQGTVYSETETFQILNFPWDSTTNRLRYDNLQMTMADADSFFIWHRRFNADGTPATADGRVDANGVPHPGEQYGPLAVWPDFWVNAEFDYVSGNNAVVSAHLS